MKRLLYFCLLAILGMACMDDLGSYDYTDLNEITIDTLRAKTIEIYDTLKVEATVKTSLEKTELEYCWYYYTGNKLEVDTLSLEKELRYKINFSVGDYTIYLQVTDVATGLSAKSNFILSVVGKFDKGLMVLGEVDQIPNFLFINEAGNVVEIYGEENGHELGSRPVWVADASSVQIPKVKDMLVLCQDERGGVTLNNADLSVAADFKDLFYVAPTRINPQAYYKGVDLFNYGTMADFIINNGKLHARLLGAAGDMPWLGEIAFNPAVPGDYELSPWAIVNGKAYLFYDNKNGRFLVLKGDMMSLDNSFSTIASATSDFDPSNTGLSLVYMAEGTPSGRSKRGYGIFQDKQGQLVKLIFSLGAYSDTWGGADMTLISKTNVTHEAVGIADAQSYAMSLAKPFLFYAKGSKIYQYGLDNNMCFPVYDADTVKIDGLTAKHTIDKIYIEYVPYYDGYGSTSADYNTVMYVAVSEDGTSGKGGSIHVLKLADNGTVESRTALYGNVCGKTVSMCYKR